MSDLETLRGNLAAVRERIARAAERAGRRAEDVLLIGVSKTVPAERVRLGVEAGLAALGENRVQEVKEKIKILGRPVPWHLIGPLQTNKVRDTLELLDVIHSEQMNPNHEFLSSGLVHQLPAPSPSKANALPLLHCGYFLRSPLVA